MSLNVVSHNEDNFSCPTCLGVSEKNNLKLCDYCNKLWTTENQGQILLLRLAQDLEEYGKVEQMPKLEGKRMIMFMAPKKSK